jgi:integrase/recombinase XerC
MNTNVSTDLIQFDRLQLIKNQIFDTIDVSENTRQEYGSRIKHFIQYVQTTGINQSTYLGYKRFLSANEILSVSTKNKYLISAKVFLDGLYRLQLIPIKITDNIKGFKQSKLHKKDGLSDSDIEKLQYYCSTMELTQSNQRLRAIIALFLFQGLRQIEVVRLNVDDIDLRSKIAFIHGKNKDDKEPMHLHPETVKVLRLYIKDFPYCTGAMFRSDSNNGRGQRITTKSIRVIIKQVFNILDIDGTAHGFRHFFITKLIKSYKGELLTVSKYSRHSSIQMLEVYNDEVIREQDLPRFYDVFNGIKL